MRLHGYVTTMIVTNMKKNQSWQIFEFRGALAIVHYECLLQTNLTPYQLLHPVAVKSNL